jgi:hypothetical protein
MACVSATVLNSALLRNLSLKRMLSDSGTYQESCPLGVLELRTSMHLYQFVP